MKKIFTLLVAVFLTTSLFSQSPEKMSYQAVIRNTNSNLVSNTGIALQISILQGSISGAAVYVETQTPTTNANGLVSIELGGGTVVSGNFSTINWANGPYFLKTETDPDGATGGISYTITGVSQLLSVPYALHAKTADNGITGVQTTKLAGIADGAEVNVQANWTQTTNTADDYIKNKPANIDEDKTDDVTTTGNQTIAGNKTFTGTTTVAAPVNATDAATKAYVDARIEALEIETGIKVKDYDGNVYNTVTIGTQVWMKENLKTTHYANGTEIPLVTGNSNWDALSGASKAYCWYNDDIANKATYGALYTWAAAMNGAASTTINPSGIQGVCPAGWHLPSDAEWTQLENYLADNGYNYDGTTGGGIDKIAKSLASTSGWSSSTNTGAVGNTDYPDYRNKSGFTAMPGGYRDSDGGAFTYIKGNCTLWSATEFSSSSAFSHAIYSIWIRVNRTYYNKENGFSVRCVRN